jgi:hypothetical protein
LIKDNLERRSSPRSLAKELVVRWQPGCYPKSRMN